MSIHPHAYLSARLRQASLECEFHRHAEVMLAAADALDGVSLPIISANPDALAARIVAALDSLAVPTGLERP